MISVEVKKFPVGGVPDVVEIHLDRAGLEALLAQLAFIKSGNTEHVHLMSEAWGGTHLENEAATGDGSPVQHLKIQLH